MFPLPHWLLPGSHYEKVRTTNVAISLAEKDGTIVCETDKWKKQKWKYRSLFIKYKQMTFLKAS